MTEEVKDVNVNEETNQEAETTTEKKPVEDNKPKYNPEELTKEGWVSPEEAARIRKALADANEADKNKRLKLKSYEEAGMTPEEIAALVTERQELELKRAEESKNWEDYKKSLEKTYETKISTYEEQLNQTKSVVDRYKQTLENTLIDKELQSAIVELGGKSPTVLTKLLRENIKLHENEDGSFETYVVDQFGQVKEKEGKKLGIKDFVAEMREDAEIGLLFEAPKVSGSNSVQVNGGNGGKSAAPKMHKSKMTPEQMIDYRQKYGKEAFDKLPR